MEEIIEFLLKHGADINLPDKYDRYPLHEACRTPRKPGIKFNLDLLKLLLKHGANINNTDDHGETVLHTIFYNVGPDVSFLEAVQILVANGADVNASSNWRYTPLHYSGYSLEITQFLVESGAKIDVRSTGL